ncbi:MAG: bifunctional diaminohydroxyphosphoribosylaminopyrimidine deaminase/5-amino-6-(5-phosphoribosylamino)uracil reductase RibD [Pseudomonadota bacterium]|nr:bifunctional diaminohydroxyphosphoribosylaminopyrimidine deaminase/5-amino-6-(5-phosphoribosylamino)uracil reductase RibD [Pseudomonadota bacterium]
MKQTSIKFGNQDLASMRTALSLARRGLGNVWPNPAVGCILVRNDLNNRIVGRGWTQAGGRPHGEIEAINRAQKLAEGSVAYITLEPCNHHGETPPCSESLINAGIKRCVIAIKDPDPRVLGSGINRLREAGIDIELGVCEKDAKEINAGFFLRIQKGRPLFTLKTATTIDGRIATSRGKSKWITGKKARAFAHKLRANHDAIMIGIRTALIDNPLLSCRLPGLEELSPIRIVADTNLRLPNDCALVKTAATIPTWVITKSIVDLDRCSQLEDLGVNIIKIDIDKTGHLDLDELVTELGNKGLTRVLVEGGGALAAAMIKKNLIDELAWFRSAKIIGGDGLGAIAPFGINEISKAPTFFCDSIARIGDDIFETYRRIS